MSYVNTGPSQLLVDVSIRNRTPQAVKFCVDAGPSLGLMFEGGEDVAPMRLAGITTDVLCARSVELGPGQSISFPDQAVSYPVAWNHASRIVSWFALGRHPDCRRGKREDGRLRGSVPLREALR